MAEPDAVVIGIDPGSEKCGLAVVRRDGEITRLAIVPRLAFSEALREILAEHPEAVVAVGDRTASVAVIRAVREVVGERRVWVVDEHHSTLRARALYWKHNPPSALARLIPESMRVPPRPVDDYAAAVLALDYLARADEASKDSS